MTLLLLWMKEPTLESMVLPAGRDLRFESPCKVKRFLALAAEWPVWPAVASAEMEARGGEAVSSSRCRRRRRRRGKNKERRTAEEV